MIGIWKAPTVLGALVLAQCGLPPPEQSGKVACRSDKDCLRGRSCVEGVCGGTAADNSANLPTCPQTPCTAPAECFYGLCSEAFEVQPPCEPYLWEDGCPAGAMCFDDTPVPRCHRLPACATNGECPVGPRGSVCNQGDIPGKSTFCTPTMCRTVGHCPTDWRCIRIMDGDPLGYCSNGTNGMACRQDTECVSNNCNELFRVCL